MSKISTHYSMMWHSHTQTADYKLSVSEMQKAGMKHPYIENILRISFDAGYKGRVENLFKKLINYDPASDQGGKNKAARKKSS
jgi:hypothetical protein